MLEAGWGIDPSEQTLVHAAGVKVPVELQNRSMVVKGWIRIINEESNEADMQQPASICAVKADVTPDLRLGPTGWNLDERNCGAGRHHASCFQDPTLVRPQMSGNLARTTLLRDHGEWYVLELCEPLEGLIDLGADVYGYDGPRDLLTIITEGGKDPVLMGFKLLGEEPPLFPDPERRDAADDVLQAPEDLKCLA